MAREAQDREDLLRDATAFVTRLQLVISSGPRAVEVFAGFRSAGAASFYFDQDPVYHFNHLGQLRRAFVDGVLIKSERGQLVVWRPQRTADAVTMVRHEMSSAEQQKFCQTAARQLGDLRQAIADGGFMVAGQVLPEATGDQDALRRLTACLEQCSPIEVAASPHVTGSMRASHHRGPYGGKGAGGKGARNLL